MIYYQLLNEQIVLLSLEKKFLVKLAVNHSFKYDSDSSVEERRVSDRKVADSWFDFLAGNACLCPWEGA